MKNYLLELSKTPEGKRFLLSVYYASKTSLTNNDVLRQYLCSLKNNNDVSDLFLEQKTFEYKGELVSLMGLDIFLRYHVEDYDPHSTSSSNLKIAEKKIGRNITTFDEIDLKQYFEDIDKDSYRYGEEFGANGYAWCSKFSEEKDWSPEELGIAGIAGGLLAVKFPLENYTLHYPTAIEAYGNDINKNKWYYGNIESHEKWGCTVDISKVTNSCTEEELRGLPEGLLKIKFSKEHDVRFVKKVTYKKGYFDDKYSTFSGRMNDYFDASIVDKIILNIMGENDECG